MRELAVIATALFLGLSSFALGQTMSPDAVKKKLEAAGYTMVEKIKPAGDGYTAVAMKGGKMVNIKIGKDGKVAPAK